MLPQRIWTVIIVKTTSTRAKFRIINLQHLKNFPSIQCYNFKCTAKVMNTAIAELDNLEMEDACCIVNTASRATLSLGLPPLLSNQSLMHGSSSGVYFQDSSQTCRKFVINFYHSLRKQIFCI